MGRVGASIFDKTLVSLSFMGAACLYGWSHLLGAQLPTAQQESLWGVVVPLAMALVWRWFERRDVCRAFALLCSAVGVVATLLILYPPSAWADEVGVALRSSVNAAMLLLWCQLYGRMPVARSAFTFGGMQIASCVLVLLFCLLPSATFPGLAMAMPLVCFFLFEIAWKNLDETGLTPFPTVEHPRVSRDLRWKMLAAAFACALAFGLAKGSSSGMLNVVAFGCSGVILLAVVLLLQRHASIQVLFNVAVPLLVAGLVAGSIVGGGSSEISGLLTGAGYALVMALFTVVLADRAFRFGVPAIWSIGIVRAVLSAGRFMGAIAAGAMQAFPQHSVLLGLATMLAVLLASIAWMQDVFSTDDGKLSLDATSIGVGPRVDFEAGYPKTQAADEGSFDEVDAKLRVNLEDVDPASVIRGSLLMRCGELGSEYHLSKREQEVLECLAFGWSITRIQDKLVISNSTAKTHIRHIYSKLGIHSRDDLEILLGVDAF